MSLSSPNSDAPRLRVLCVLANPSDLAKFDSERTWSELSQAVAGVEAVALERLRDPTETGLRQSLKEGLWDVLHWVGHGEERSVAHYGTLALQAADGRARNLTAAYLADWLSGCSSLKLIVLQSCDEKSHLDVVAEILAGKGAAAVVLPALDGKLVNEAVSRMYASVAAGLTANALAEELRSATEPGVIRTRIISRFPEQAIWTANSILKANPVAPARPVEIPRPAEALTSSISHLPPAPLAQSEWDSVLAEKRKQGRFDVFLCHNSIDKPTVKQIAHRLKEKGILPWLDVWELPPGQPWQPLLETQIEAIRAAAVFVGAAGVAPWQENEMRGFLEEFRNRDMPVIPVLLPGSPSAPRLPLFLRQMTWVDFRSEDPDPLQLLIWGITGERPRD